MNSGSSRIFLRMRNLDNPIARFVSMLAIVRDLFQLVTPDILRHTPQTKRES